MTLGDPGHSEEHRRLELALEVAGLGEFEWDMVGGVFVVSRRMAAITGLPEGPMPAAGTRELEPFIHPEDLETFRAQRDSPRPGGGLYEFEFRYVRPDDGRTVWVRVASVLARDPDGRPRSATGIVEDITQRKQEEDQRQTMMAELDHRVKNVLATVQSLAIQTARRTTSLDGFLEAFGGRLKAMGSANELLTAARWRARRHRPPGRRRAGGARARPDGLGGARAVPDPARRQRAGARPARARRQCAEVRGALGGDRPGEAQLVAAGRRRLRTDLDRERRPHRAPPARRGFGSTLLEQVTGRELNGSVAIDYRPAGVQARLRAGPAAVRRAPRPAPPPRRCGSPRRWRPPAGRPTCAAPVC